MFNTWTTANVEAILLQLDRHHRPFGRYTLSLVDGRPVLLGKGASAYVYKVCLHCNEKKNYALKVIGFGNTHMDSPNFHKIVSAQKDLSANRNDIVKIYDAAELRVWIEGEHTVTKIETVNSWDAPLPPGNYLNLQFVLMEELTPVIARSPEGKPVLSPEELGNFQEQEIVKLAYDIGVALENAHSHQVLHRDIKLENIFYSPKQKRYKLGDFGIATATQDGLASTIAFTKGYGAPEIVGALEDRYDCTADIYSFGMLLYVLLNRLRFPGSKSYQPDTNMQYTSGFSPEPPATGSEELCNIVLQMLRFSPDDRYQTMEQVLNALDQVKYGSMAQYQQEHKRTPFFVGAYFFLIGMALWKLSFAPFQDIDITAWTYGYILLLSLKAVLRSRHKESLCLDLAHLGLGIYLVFTSGNTWWLVLLMLLFSFFQLSYSLIFAGGVLAVSLAGFLSGNYPQIVEACSRLKWLSATLLSLSFFLLYFFLLLEDQRRKLPGNAASMNPYARLPWNQIYWGAAAALYISIFLIYLEIQAGMMPQFLMGILESIGYQTIVKWDPMLIGVTGGAFCLIWFGRELYMQSRKKGKQARTKEKPQPEED